MFVFQGGMAWRGIPQPTIPKIPKSEMVRAGLEEVIGNLDSLPDETTKKIAGEISKFREIGNSAASSLNKGEMAAKLGGLTTKIQGFLRQLMENTGKYGMTEEETAKAGLAAVNAFTSSIRLFTAVETGTLHAIPVQQGICRTYADGGLGIGKAECAKRIRQDYDGNAMLLHQGGVGSQLNEEMAANGETLGQAIERHVSDSQPYFERIRPAEGKFNVRNLGRISPNAPMENMALYSKTIQDARKGLEGAVFAEALSEQILKDRDEEKGEDRLDEKKGKKKQRKKRAE